MHKAGEPQTETIREFVDSRGAQLRVDRTKGVIHGVKILGLVSKNGREYDAGAVTKARPMYEGAKVNVNHSRGNPSGPRDYQDRMGQIRQVSVAADGLYGDFHFNPKHPLAEQLIWDAENAPENVGFSHNVEARTAKRGGKVVVEEITGVTSVDLVADPATTRGLYEAQEIPAGASAELRELAEGMLCLASDIRSAVLSGEPITQIKKRLSERLATGQTAVSEASQKTTTETSQMDPKEITLEWLNANRKDLVEQLTGTDALSKLGRDIEAQKAANAKLQEELKAVNAKAAAMEAEQAKAAKAKAIAEELKAANLELADDAAGKTFREQLDAAPDAAARKRLIEALVAFRGPVSHASGGYSSAAPLSPIEEGAASTGPAKTTEEFVSRLR